MMLRAGVAGTAVGAAERVVAQRDGGGLERDVKAGNLDLLQDSQFTALVFPPRAHWMFSP